jgi:hypothetical protein
VTDGLPRLPFDREAWLAAGNTCLEGNPRLAMALDLVENHLREGMSRADVHTLLGPPESDDESAQSVGWSYSIGPGTPCSLFYVGFDSADRLVEWFQVRM